MDYFQYILENMDRNKLGEKDTYCFVVIDFSLILCFGFDIVYDNA